ncbi:lantibiotic synthetase [Streptococcus suis]|uniref:Lantibiotic synthetase n=1 Tax=Streptococcus suis TaxID=1307 RepID=A0A116LAB1_STRSU|nr:type 2 lanthipeptide synthetase LanM [Streptococcus suis]NQH39257.1 type 2 lantipeptide synthetase LanM [Streptococcus suis]CYU82082.1 lantibiotic synthetase [Streptococcus suis]
MKYSREQVFPEVDEIDYKNSVEPLLEYNRNNLKLKKSDYYSNQMLVSDISENYPYQKLCNAVVDRIWNTHWLSEFDSDFVDYNVFRKTICEQLSQMVFSHFIRCFAEQIKECENEQLNKQEIYALYNSKLVESNLEIFREKYPVGWARCHNMLENRVISLGVMLKRLRKHRTDIFRRFNLSNSEKIYSIQSGGDVHNNGQTVNIIEFDTGEKIIYKPRSVSGEVCYRKFVVTFNELFKTNLLSIRALDFDTYGFTEFIERVVDEKNYDMTHAGRLLCMMYMLNASDMHFENVFWTSQGPVPIDLETLFQPLRQKQVDKVEDDQSAYSKLARSVCGTGILPYSLDNQGNSDVGFTGFRDENTRSPVKTLYVRNGFSSNINIRWNSDELDNTSDSLIKDIKFEIFVVERCKKVTEGFTELYQKISEKREVFKKLVWDSFRDMKIRYLHNMTYRYEQILRVLTAAEPSQRIDLAHMLVSRLALLSSTSDVSLPISESKQIRNGDIPYLYVQFDSNVIADSNGRVAMLTTSPMNEFSYKLQNLNDQDLVNQVRLIKLSFLSRLADSHDGKVLDDENIINTSTGTYRPFENDLSQIIENIVDSALTDRFSHLPETWIGPISRRGSGWVPGVLGYDLYSGRVGIAIVLLLYGKYFKDQKSYNLSKEIFEKISNILNSESFDKGNLLKIGSGAYSGISGMLWTLYKAGEISQNEEWMRVSKISWKFVAEEDIIDGDFFDIISGGSGSIVLRYSMLSDYRLPNNLLSVIIDKGYEQILNIDEQTTSGLAHGLGNLIWFFSIINRKHKDERIEILIKKVHEVILNKFMNNKKEILVYNSQNESNISNSWCNGLSGLLLAYYEAYKSNVIEKDFVIKIIEQLKRNKLPVIPTLCHGGIGVVEILEYIKDEFHVEVEPILNYLYNILFCPNQVVEYLKSSDSRYALGQGLLTGNTGALLYLFKQKNKSIKFNPLVLR